MDTNQIIKEQVELAPEEIKQILKSGSWSQTVNQISLTNNLSLEQKTALENEVLFVLLGMSLSTKLTENIQNSLSVNEMLAEKISSEIKTKIISSVNSLLPTEEESDEKLPEIPPEDLPAIIPGNLPTDNNVPRFEKNYESGITNKESAEHDKPKPQGYPQGQDPYREPIE